MKKRFCKFSLMASLFLSGAFCYAQPVDTPQAAGVTPVTGDVAPWRAFGADAGSFDSVWIIALNNGNVVAFKRGSDPAKPGVIGGSNFLLFGPDGTLKSAMPVQAQYQSNGQPFPYADYGATGVSWGGFTLGAHADRANGTGFVVHDLAENFQTFGFELGDVMGNESFTLAQRFNNDGAPVGAAANAFGDLLAEAGDYRDIGAIILSNGDIAVLGEDRQPSDDLKASVNASGEAAIAVILGPDGKTKFGPFVPHIDANNQYLGGNSSVIYQNMAAFEGGFVIDYGSGIRWYNNDGTPRTPVQPDHAELAGTDIDTGVTIFTIGADSGGRGDNMALASNGKDLVVKSIKLETGSEGIGILVYYNTDGTVRHWVRFDDTDFNLEPGMVDRTFCDMDQNGNVFVVWEDLRFGGDQAGEHAQVFGRFFDKDGKPAGSSFPVFENWKKEPETVDYGAGVGLVPRGELTQPRCAINNQVAAVISNSTLMPDIPEVVKQLSAAFGLVMAEPVVRIFQNPLAGADVREWSVY